ncbi:MAG: hypothetical protein JJU29_17435 [Verrucomicrobia bacterium]|nr:hypothetical protein [Verrucomicrobiota bacterium]MCH8513423.1 hypothetical protein [Kiritimatiellia bacterium]
MATFQPRPLIACLALLAGAALFWRVFFRFGNDFARLQPMDGPLTERLFMLVPAIALMTLGAMLLRSGR